MPKSCFTWVMNLLALYQFIHVNPSQTFENIIHDKERQLYLTKNAVSGP